MLQRLSIAKAIAWQTIQSLNQCTQHNFNPHHLPPHLFLSSPLLTTLSTILFLPSLNPPQPPPNNPPFPPPQSHKPSIRQPQVPHRHVCLNLQSREIVPILCLYRIQNQPLPLRTNAIAPKTKTMHAGTSKAAKTIVTSIPLERSDSPEHFVSRRAHRTGISPCSPT